MKKKFPKSLSTSNFSKSKLSGNIGSNSLKSSLKGSKSTFKFREPYFCPLHKISAEELENSTPYLKNWSERRVLSPPKRRSFHSSCVYKDFLYIFGGKDITEGKLSDIAKLKLTDKDAKWETVTPSNDTLEPLAYHTGTLINDKYYIIGGNDKYIRQSPFIYIYSINDNVLKKIRIEKNGDICYLAMHSANYYQAQDEIILFGGYSEGEMLNSIFKYNINSDEITKVDYSEEDKNNIPSPRTGHTSFIINNDLYIFGGSMKDGRLLNDLWKLDLKKIKWSMIKTENPPSPRSGHSLLNINDKIYIFGGKIGNFQESNDLWEYDLKNNKFLLLHDTMLEQFTDEEIEEFKLEEQNKKNKKGDDFHFISKKEQDDKLNPFSKFYKDNKSKLVYKSQSTKELNKNEYENEIFINPGYYQMKHSSIFNLDNKDMNSAILMLDMLLPYKIGDKGIKMPLPRDGQTLDHYEGQLIVFGGDRNKYPFNDLYFLKLI